MAVVLIYYYSENCRIEAHSNDLKCFIFREITGENSHSHFGSQNVSKVSFLSHLELKCNSRTSPGVMLNYTYAFISNKLMFCSSIIVNNSYTESHWTKFRWSSFSLVLPAQAIHLFRCTCEHRVDGTQTPWGLIHCHWRCNVPS
jgi:hypothetical protein